MNNTKYYLAAIAAYATWGFFSLVLKPLAAYPSVDILFYRVFSCAALMLIIVVLFKRQTLTDTIATYKSLPANQKRTIVLINIGGSIFLMANWFSFIYVLNHVSIKASSLAYLVCPVLTTLLAWSILKEKLKKLQWAAVGLSVTACLLLSYENIADMFYGILIGLSYACYLVSQRLNTGFDKFIVLTFHIVLAALVLLVFYPWFSGPVPVAFKFYFYIELIAVAFTIIPLFLNLYALKRLNSSTVGMLLNINPIIGFALATAIYGENISQLQAVCYALIFISVIVFNVQQLFKGRQVSVIQAN